MHPTVRRCLGLSWVLLGALSSLSAAAANKVSVDLSVPYLTGKVTLDGRLEESQWRQAARLGNTDFSRWVKDRYQLDPSQYVVRLFHDGKSLYLSLASYDGSVAPDKQPENADGLHSFSVITRSGELQHYRLRWNTNPPEAGGELKTSGKWGARLRGPFADSSRSGAGYVLEISIPLLHLGWRPGSVVPVNLIINDHDGKPRNSIDDPGVEFARFAWGSLDNDKRAAYRRIKLEPSSVPQSSGSAGNALPKR